MSKLNTRHTVVALSYLLFLFPVMFGSALASSATSEGQYGVRGAALVSCEIFERERKAQSELYRMPGSWVDGYISGINQQTPGVYNITSFESNELIAALVSEHCSKNPQDSMFAVVKLLIDKMAANKLTESSKKISVALGERSVLLYVDTIKRVQEKLRSLNFYKGEIDGEYSSSLQKAIGSYQTSIELKPTKFPDQLTLWRLFTDL